MNHCAVPRRALAAVAVGAVLLAACAGTDEISTPTVDVPETVAVGVMPEPLSDSPTLPPPPSPPTTAAGETSTGETDGGPTGPLALPLRDHVAGDRLLFIGDGTLASAAPGADRQLCDALSIFGWEAEIATFAGVDDLSYVPAVLDLRFRPDDGVDWDAIVLWVGNEVPGDGLGIEELTATLDQTIERVAPRPVVLYTLTESDPGRARFNEVIRAAADERPNVAIIDWAELAGAADEVFAEDGVTLALDGRKRLPLITAQALGEAPVDQDGGCLDPDDGQDDDEN